MSKILIPALSLGGLVYLFMQQPQFGKAPSGERLERIKKSRNYKDGQFQNIHPTPMLAEGANYFSMAREFLFANKDIKTPAEVLPSKKINLHALEPNEDILVWFGHSSYFMQLDGKKILVDPVFSGSASPVSFTTRSFRGSDAYTAEDMPEIDYLFISHDHWDHLDYETVLAIEPKVQKVVTGLGVGAHLEHWGYAAEKITESDWGEEVQLDNGFMVNIEPARHFSGRSLKRNASLWVSFVLQTPNRKVYMGGDSGYDAHFKTIGDKFGPFDLAILENGQYDKSWKYIHMMPEEVVQAAEDLQAKQLLPVHWAKFSLSNHAWNEPIVRVQKEARRKNVPVIHPLIGEKVKLFDGELKYQAAWWEEIN